MLVDEISTKIKRWTIILTVETVGFLTHMGYKIRPSTSLKDERVNGTSLRQAK